jgi:hypothetical protein
MKLASWLLVLLLTLRLSAADCSVLDAKTGEVLIDADCDVWPDAVDNCPVLANADQADANGDGLGDACTADVTYAYPASVTLHAGESAFVPLHLHNTGGASAALTYDTHLDASIGDAHAQGVSRLGVGEDAIAYVYVQVRRDAASGSAPLSVVVRRDGVPHALEMTLNIAPSARSWQVTWPNLTYLWIGLGIVAVVVLLVLLLPAPPAPPPYRFA